MIPDKFTACLALLALFVVPPSPGARAADGVPAGSAAAAPAAPSPTPGGNAGAEGKAMSKPDPELQKFLDRLMHAESGGRDTLRNPLSTATGPFQFIEATFIEVVRRNFADEVAGLGQPQILALRTNRAFARKAAEAYTIENAGRLAGAGVKPTFAHLRLAYLVGPAAAIRVVKMPPATPVALVLGPAAIKANPFLARYTASDLVARAARDVSVDPSATAGVEPRPGAPGKKKAARAIEPPCNLAHASCRKWLVLAERRLASGQKVVGVRN